MTSRIEREAARDERDVAKPARSGKARVAGEPGTRARAHVGPKPCECARRHLQVRSTRMLDQRAKQCSTIRSTCTNSGGATNARPEVIRESERDALGRHHS